MEDSGANTLDHNVIIADGKLKVFVMISVTIFRLKSFLVKKVIINGAHKNLSLYCL